MQARKRSTVNAELAALRRAFNLAVKARRLPLSAKPSISTPDPHNARSGFFEDADFRAVLAELPEPLRPAMEFAFWTGWRIADEVLALTWAQVDFAAGMVRLEPNTTKSDQGRSFPFTALPELADLLDRQREHTSAVERRLGVIAPTVFHRNGRPILSYLDAWRAACKRAAVVKRDGLECVVTPRLVGRTPHDFRRTAARNLIRAGVASACGHAALRLENGRDVSPLRHRGRAGSQKRGGNAGEGHNGGTIEGEGLTECRMMLGLSRCGGTSARGESRTRTGLPPVDFESTASAVPPLGPGGKISRIVARRKRSGPPAIR